MKSIVVVGLALVMLNGIAPAQRVLRVPTNHATIQAAIDAARGSDVVLVAPGTYPETIDFKGKAITVRSSAGRALTTIDGQKRGPVVRFVSGEARGSMLEGFTITNGAGIVTAAGSEGAGIYCVGASPTIRDNRIAVNQITVTAGHRGAGIYARGGAPRILRNRISDNWCGEGGGVFLDGPQGALIRDNDFRRNSGWVAGGGLACAGGNASILGNRFSFCGSVQAGAGIHAANATLRIRGNVLTGCDATGGTGGAMHLTACRVESTNNAVNTNFAFLEAPGIYANGCTMTSTNDTFAWNGSRGTTAGIFVTNTTLTIANGIFWGGVSGGGTFEISLVAGSTVAIDHSNVEGGLRAVNVAASTLNWGTSMIDVDPRFIGTVYGPTRLGSDSPCRDVGTRRGAPTVDFEGDPRTNDAGIDLGADEFHPHLDFTRRWPDGSLIQLTIMGPPSMPSYLGVSLSTRLARPTPIPGLTGGLRLLPPIGVIPLGRTSPFGAYQAHLDFRAFPPATLTVQALAGTDLTNALPLELP